MKPPSKTFCILPWTHACLTIDSTYKPCCHWYYDTVNLELGPFEGITSLNSKHYKDIRQSMLNGEELHYCKTCLVKEEHLDSSMRTYFNDRYKNDIEFCNSTEFHKLRYIEIALDNTCNLQCRMCSSKFSSALSRVETAIGITPAESLLNFTNLDSLKSLDLSNLREVRIIGGEPFYSKKHNTLLTTLIEQSFADQIRLIYATNGTIYNDDIVKLWLNFKQINLAVSLDGVGEINDYQRAKSSFKEIEINIEKFKKIENVTLTFNAAITILNLLNLSELLTFTDNKLSYNFDEGNLSVLVAPTYTKEWILTHLQSTLPSEHFKLIKNKLMSYKEDLGKWQNVLRYIVKLDKYHGTYLKNVATELFNHLDDNYNFTNFYEITK